MNMIGDTISRSLYLQKTNNRYPSLEEAKEWCVGKTWENVIQYGFTQSLVRAVCGRFLGRSAVAVIYRPNNEMLALRFVSFGLLHIRTVHHQQPPVGCRQ